MTIRQTILDALTDPGIQADVAAIMEHHRLGYDRMLTILEEAADGGMTASKFATLETLASLLNAPDGIRVSSYVKDITESLVGGDGANTTWTGGSSTPVGLGNLNATASQTHIDELIGEWFLGTNLPNLSVSSIGVPNFCAQYEPTTNPLYGASGAPSYLDVNQGYDGDCYFLSSLAEVALQDPNAIESMIHDDGNGTYGVRFIVDGHADWVTVNDELPTMPSGYSHANGSNLEFANGDIAWPELLEKAYAELNAEPNAPHGAQLDTTSDSYAGISGGGAYALTEITGQAVTGFVLRPTMSASALSSDASQIGAAWSSKEELLVGTSNNVSGDLVADHMFQVVGYSPASDTLTLHNPWGSAYSGPLGMTFTESLSSLAANDCAIWMTIGKPLA